MSLIHTIVLLAALATQQRPQAPYVPPVDPAVARLVPPSPAPGGFIADVPGLLAAGDRAALNARIGALQAAGLGDVGVAIVPSIADRAPADLGVAIYRTWRIGRVDTLGAARRNLGVLLLIVPKELAPDGRGHCWITTGTGAEGVVTDAASGAICRDRVVPRLKERDYAGAVGAALDGIEARLRGDAGLAEAGEPTDGGGGRDGGGFPWAPVGGGLAGALGLGGAIAGVRRWRRNRPRRCPRCGGTMMRLDEQADDAALEAGQRVEERVRSVDYDVWACGACGERTVLPYKAIFTGYHACRECGRRTCRSRRRTLVAPTTSATGTAEESHSCEACHAAWSERVVLAKVSASSGSGGSGSSGGGSSFGGSGSTSGGGGGSSY